MTKHYISLGVLTLIVIAAVIYGMIAVGSPFTERAQKLDANRISDLSIIRASVEQFYQAKHLLPTNYEEATQYVFKKVKDSETGKDYDYVKKSDFNYDLCATFSAEFTDKNASSYAGDTSHDQGYDCISYSIPEYMRPALMPTFPTMPFSTSTPGIFQ